MSFDVLFLSCHFTSEFEQVTNPFTRKPMRVQVNSGLSSDERKAVLELLRQHKARGPDKFGYYHVPLRNDRILELSASGLEGTERFTNCMIHLRGLDEEVAEFMFELSRRGNMLIAAQDEPEPLATAESQLQSLPPDHPPAKLIRSSDELGDSIGAGFGHWKEFRDHVVGDDGIDGSAE